ncbi:NYN domain-containing protein [Paenibacillus chungangensis]|uniref:NYN domain-containing protein n=1 Tax=Paenibacillus chungangensis TaxID=696535 RepID=A0ABW3HNJ4_9BACL
MWIQGPKDFTSYRRMMIFIDGENITMRFQELLSKGMVPRESVKHLKDVYAWDENTTSIIGKHEVIRAVFYTYAVGDNQKIDEINESIKSFNYFKNYNSELPNKLFPCVFKKENRSRSGKGVDIQMTVDILHHSHNDNLDTVFLITGDGDFMPVINEVIRAGKQIYLASFTSGLNPQLKKNVDYYLNLDPVFFQTE